jgi:LysM repeat protein
MRDRRWRRTASGLVALGLLLAGCNGDDAPEPAGSPTPAATSPGATPAPVEAPTAATPPTPTPNFPEPASGATETAYVVQEGDNLTTIAEQFGTTVDAIVQANDIEDPNVILVGQELIIPAS